MTWKVALTVILYHFALIDGLVVIFYFEEILTLSAQLYQSQKSRVSSRSRTIQLPSSFLESINRLHDDIHAKWGNAKV